MTEKNYSHCTLIEKLYFVDPSVLMAITVYSPPSSLDIPDTVRTPSSRVKLLTSHGSDRGTPLRMREYVQLTGLARAVRLISWLAPSMMSNTACITEGSNTGLTETINNIQ